MDQATPTPRILDVQGIVFRLLPASSYCVRYTPETLIAGFAFESQQGVHAFASDRVRPFFAGAHGLAFTPKDCSVYSEARKGGEYLTLTMTVARARDLLPDNTGALPSEQFSGLIDPRGMRSAYAIRRAILTENHDSSLVEILAANFLRAICRCGIPNFSLPPAARSLTLRRMRIIEDLIEARLDEQLPISEMAKACGLSTGFFIRAFKAATGQTPHRFLMERRVSRARALLGNTQETACQIAHMTGFASQAHMSFTFKRALGVTPSELRSAIKRLPN